MSSCLLSDDAATHPGRCPILSTGLAVEEPPEWIPPVACARRNFGIWNSPSRALSHMLLLPLPKSPISSLIDPFRLCDHAPEHRVPELGSSSGLSTLFPVLCRLTLSLIGLSHVRLIPRTYHHILQIFQLSRWIFSPGSRRKSQRILKHSCKFCLHRRRSACRSGGISTTIGKVSFSSYGITRIQREKRRRLRRAVVNKAVFGLVHKYRRLVAREYHCLSRTVRTVGGSDTPHSKRGMFLGHVYFHVSSNPGRALSW